VVMVKQRLPDDRLGVTSQDLGLALAGTRPPLEYFPRKGDKEVEDGQNSRLDDGDDDDDDQDANSDSNDDSHLHVFPPDNVSVCGSLPHTGQGGTYHICLRTLLAPLRNPWAETARVSGC
jgi:hypothetical protein